MVTELFGFVRPACAFPSLLRFRILGCGAWRHQYVASYKYIYSLLLNVTRQRLITQDTPDTKEQSLLDLDKAIEMAGEIPSLKALKAIVTIVLNGLLPLVNAIEQNAEAR